MYAIRSYYVLGTIGVGTEGLIRQVGRKTSKKSRIIASNQQILRYDKESKDSIALLSEKSVVSYVESVIGECDIVIISDYGKGVITESVASGVIAAAKKAGKKVLVDPKGKDYRKYSGAYLLTPNKKDVITSYSIHYTKLYDLPYLLHFESVVVPSFSLLPSPFPLSPTLHR